MNLDELMRFSRDMNNTGPDKIIESLVGKKVPLSESKKAKLLKYRDGSFEFDYDGITKEQQNYFINWLSEYVTKELNKVIHKWL